MLSNPAQKNIFSFGQRPAAWQRIIAASAMRR
jgi:hypothetical protein